MLKALIAHLRDHKDEVVKKFEVKGGYWDYTNGWQSRMEEIEVVDFDRLLQEMDAFSETFKDLTGDK